MACAFQALPRRANHGRTNELAGRSWTRFVTDAKLKQVSQLELFDSCHGMLADDERGRITYIPRFVGAETAQAWFTELRSGVRWRSERREMYDREVDVPYMGRKLRPR